MNTTFPPDFLYYLHDGLLCLINISGIVAGIILLVRKRYLPGALAITAFVLVGAEIIFRRTLWNLIYNNLDNRSAYVGIFNWLSLCLSSPLIILGTIAFVVLTFTLIKPKQPELPYEAAEKD